MARFAVAAIDPDFGQTHLRRRHHVVGQRLRDVQNLARQNAEIAAHALEHEFEIAQIRLVAADILRGVDRVPLDFETRVAAHVADPVAIGQRRHAVMPPQVGERGRRIGERRPVLDRLAERDRLVVGELDLPFLRERAGDVGEQVAVHAARRFALLAQFELGEQLEHLVALEPDRQLVEQRRERRVNAALPVDQRAVGIEGQEFVIGEFHASPGSKRRARRGRAAIITRGL